MGTKNSPGAYDCYANAAPDEPMFILLARDVTAEFFVAAWTAIRAGDIMRAVKIMEDAHKAWLASGKPLLPMTAPKSVEAQQCSKAMRTWREMQQIKAIEARLSSGPGKDG